MKDTRPLRPSLRQIQYFVAVAEHKSIGAAAAALSVSQPSLSKQLATMEQELGATLFERNSRSVKLSPIGAKLLPRGRKILDEAREFRAAVREEVGLFGDLLAIGVLPSVGAYFMPIANRRLHQRYPNLRLVVHEGSTEQLLTMLKQGGLDAVVGSPTRDPEVASHSLFVETLWACAASDDPVSASAGPITLDELAGRPFLSLSPVFRLAQIVERLAVISGSFVSREYQGASLDAVRQMAVMGSGVAILPSLYALGEAVRDPEFVVRRIDHPEAAHEIALLWRRAAPIADDCRELAGHLVEVKREIRAARSEKFR